MKTKLLAAVFTFATLSASVGFAQPSAEALGEARDRFQRGVELYREGSFDAALAEFKKAYEIAPNYRILYNLGQVQTERHDYVAAMKLLQQYLADGGADITAERRAEVEQEIAALRGRVGSLTVRSDADDAEVLVDGVVVGRLPMTEPAPLSAGVHQVQLRKPGYDTKTTSITIAGGEAMNLDLTLDPAPVLQSPRRSAASFDGGGDEPDDAARAESEGGGSNAGLWISLAATTVFAGGAVTFGFLTRAANDDLDRELDRFPADGDRIEDARDTLKQRALVTDALTAAAAVSAGFTLYFALSGPSRAEPREEARGVSVRVAPTVGGVRMLGRF